MADRRTVGDVPEEEWDVVVIGGGPSGCAAAAAAIQADPLSRVLIVDRSEFPRDKVCGDGIAGQALTALSEVGINRAELTDGFTARVRLRLRSPGQQQADRRLRDEAYVIPRMVFDARMMDAVLARGVSFRRHRVRRVQPDADGVVLDGILRAKVVIGADGAESTVRRELGVAGNRPGHVAVAIRGYARELPDQHGAQYITMTEHRWPAYAWSFPVGDGMANVGYGELTTDRPLHRDLLLSRMHDLLPGLDPDPVNLRAHRLPLSTQRPSVRSGRVLLVGDAQSLINPLSGEGIYYAVRSGILAGQASAAGAEAGALYRRALRRRLSRHLFSTSLLAAAMRWPRIIDSGVRAAANDQGVFDDLVELALAEGMPTARLLRRLRW